MTMSQSSQVTYVSSSKCGGGHSASAPARVVGRDCAQAGTGGKVRFPAGETGLSSLSLWVDICTWPLLLAVTGSNLVCQGSLLRSEERRGPQGSIHSAHAAEGLLALCSGKYESGSEMWV